MKAKISAVIIALLAIAPVFGAGDIKILLGENYNRYLTSSLDNIYFSASKGLKEPINLNRDFYIELLMRLDKSNGNIFICSFGGVSMRYLRGPIQWYYGNTSDGYCFNSSIPEDLLRYPESELHHVIFMNTNRICEVYVDGKYIKRSDWNGKYTKYPWDEDKNKNSTTLKFAPNHEIRLFRVGYLADADNEGEDPQTLVKTHYNGGDPLRYEETHPSRLVDMRQKHFKLSSALNPVSGVRLYPEAALNGNVFWNYRDPYRLFLRGEGSPSFTPRYAGQGYRDTLTNRRYYALDNRSPDDWKSFVYASDVKDLMLNTIGGVSLLGKGDITIGSAEPYREVVDVAALGAVGDGNTDDTAAILEALRMAKSGGKGLYFPKTAGGGIYRINSPLILDSELNVSAALGAAIVGEGALLKVTGENILVADISLVSSADSAVEIEGASKVRFERVSVESNGTAFNILNSKDVWIENADIAAAEIGLKLVNAKRLSLTGCALARAKKGVFFAGGNTESIISANCFNLCETGLFASSGDTSLTICENAFNNCTAAGVVLDGAKQVVVKTNSFADFSGSATPIKAAASYSIIADNTISRKVIDATQADIVLTGSDALSVSGNVMDGRIVTDSATRIAESSNLKAE